MVGWCVEAGQVRKEEVMKRRVMFAFHHGDAVSSHTLMRKLAQDKAIHAIRDSLAHSASGRNSCSSSSVPKDPKEFVSTYLSMCGYVIYC